MKLIKTRDYLLITLIALIFLVLGGIFDFNVSEFLYYDSSSLVNGFAVVISNYALLPFYLFSLVAAVSGLIILFQNKINRSMSFRVIFIILLIVIGGFLIYQMFDKLKDLDRAFDAKLALILSIVVSVIILGIAIWLAILLVKKYDHKTLFKYILIFASIVLISNLLMTALKYTWSRPRPWYVFGAEDIGPNRASFKNFWELQPFKALMGNSYEKEFFKSFPSNHTNNAVSTLPALLLYFKLKDNTKSWVYTLITYMIFALSLLTALTRIVAGAHFLSDVSFGLIAGFAISYFAFFILDNWNKKKEVSQ